MAKYKRPKATTSFHKRKASKKDIERRNKIIMGVFISVIMVGSILGIFVSQSADPNDLVYTNEKGEEFQITVTQNGYVIPLEDNAINFYYHPTDLYLYLNDLENIEEMFQSPQLLMLFDPEDSSAVYIDVARFDVSNALMTKNQYVYSGKTENSTTYMGLPVLSCDNSSVQLPAVYFKTGNRTSIEKQGNCLIMQGNQYDFLRFRDLIIYLAYGIMP